MNNVEFFNLNNDGDSAVVRILNTDVSKIEVKNVHSVHIEDGKKKSITCPGDGCPLCKRGDVPKTRLAVHLWDYTDNKEKIWNRTPNETFLNSLREVVSNWGNLSECVLKISRSGDNFPKYSVTVLPQNKYPMPSSISSENIDESVAYRISSYRSVDELEKFVETGVLPDHVKKQSTWIPKEEWVKKKNEEKNQQKNATVEKQKQGFVARQPVPDFAGACDDPFLV